MLQTGLSHGVAIIPNAPKQRFSDPATGAHFDFEDMCVRLEKLHKKRLMDDLQESRKNQKQDQASIELNKPNSSNTKTSSVVINSGTSGT